MLSVVVPTLNAEEDIVRCLEPFTEPAQLIVVDGGSTDKTVGLAQQAGAEVIHAPTGRGVQLRAGAAAATGEWLLFLHADSFLDSKWHAAVEEFTNRHPDKWGYFEFRLRASQWQARVLEHGVAARCRLLGLPYGDQGLLVQRSLYEEIGGFAPVPFMEDVDLVRRIGKDRLVLINAAVRTSARRWKERGWAARTGGNLVCLILFLLGVPPSRIRTLYR